MIRKVRITGKIDDTMEVEVDEDEDLSDEELIDRAHADWSFVEGTDWSGEVLD